MSSLKYIILFSLCLIILSQTCDDYCGPNGCNCYKVLNVGRRDPSYEIKRAYHSLSRRYHPDISREKDATEKFAEIATCYVILSDERSRVQYNWCIDSGYVHPSQRPRDNDSLWGLAIPILSFVFNMFRGQNRQPGQTGWTGKKILKSLGIWSLLGAIVLLLFYQAPFVLEPAFAGLRFIWDFCGGNFFYIVLVFVWGYALVKKVFQIILSFFRKGPTEEDMKSFLPKLLNVIDTYQQKIIQEINNKKASKESEIMTFKNVELECLKRYHNENIDALVKPESKEDSISESEENRVLLKSEKEVSLENIYNRNVQQCETRTNDKLKELNEEFDKKLESHQKTCEYYKDLISKFEEDMKIKIQAKKISHEELKKELEQLIKDIDTKIATNWQVQVEQKEIDG